MSNLLKRLLTPPEEAGNSIRPALPSFPGVGGFQGGTAPDFQTETSFASEEFSEPVPDSPKAGYAPINQGSVSDSQKASLRPPSPSSTGNDKTGDLPPEKIRSQETDNPKSAPPVQRLLSPGRIPRPAEHSAHSDVTAGVPADVPTAQPAAAPETPAADSPPAGPFTVKSVNLPVNFPPEPSVVRNPVTVPSARSEPSREEASGGPVLEERAAAFREIPASNKATSASAPPIRPIGTPVGFPHDAARTPESAPSDSGVSGGPAIEITIGRIEINAGGTSTPQPAPRRERRFSPVSLQEYLDSPGRRNSR